MQLEHSFTVAVGIDETWRILSDLGAISPFMPGSTIDEAVPDKVTGALKVKLGPLNLTYRGTVRLVEADESGYRAVVNAKGEDTRNGSAAATVVATLTENDGGGTHVALATDLDVTGKPAQFGRSVMADVGIKLVGQFAANLTKAIDKGKLGDTASPEAATKTRPRPQPRKAAEPASDVVAESTTEPSEPEQADATDTASDDTDTASDATEPASADTDTDTGTGGTDGYTDTGSATPSEATPASAPSASAPAASALPAEPAPAADEDDAPAAVTDDTTPSFAVPGGLPSMQDADHDTPSVNGHGRASAPPQPAPSPGLADAVRPAVVRGLAPVALALVFVLSAVRRRRGKN